MIVDTSAWIDYLQATGSLVDLRLRSALENDEPLVLPAIVQQEVLQGARTHRHMAMLLEGFDRFADRTPPPAVTLHRLAGLLYARCRWSGFTPRSPNDCVVAAHAVLADRPVLHNDRDFVFLAQVEPQLKLLSLP